MVSLNKAREVTWYHSSAVKASVDMVSLINPLSCVRLQVSVNTIARWQAIPYSLYLTGYRDIASHQRREELYYLTEAWEVYKALDGIPYQPLAGYRGIASHQIHRLQASHTGHKAMWKLWWYHLSTQSHERIELYYLRGYRGILGSRWYHLSSLRLQRHS